MRYLSVCSGIEAATVAWHPLGWQPVAFAEVSAFPSAVLAHHYPTIPNLGDLTLHDSWNLSAINLLVGGTPCQAFSVAGLREGLADPRGNLTLTFLGLVAQCRPRWVVWENVPGVLSDSTNAFGQFLSGLAKLGYGWAYRVLNAQYFGVPQRRRRVFVVAHLGSWAPAAAVLFESHSLRGHPAPSRQPRQDLAPSLSARTKGGGGLGTDAELDGALIPENTHTLRGEGFDATEDGTGRGTTIIPAYARSLRAQGHSAHQEDKETYIPETSPCLDIRAGRSGETTFHTSGGLIPETAWALQERDSKGPDSSTKEGHLIPELQAIVFDSTQITSQANRSNPQAGDPCHPLASGAHPPAIAFSCKDHGADAGTDVTPTLRSMGFDQSHANGGGQVAIAFPQRLSGTQCASSEEVSPVLQSTNPTAVCFSGRARGDDGRGYEREPEIFPPDLAGTLDTVKPHCVAFQPRIGRNGRGYAEEHTPALNGADAGTTSDMRPCVPFKPRHYRHPRKEGAASEIVGTLTAAAGEINDSSPHVAYSEPERPLIWQVRRLTPRECERLQGFPDDYTRIPYRGKPADRCPDGPRYQALGNSMAVPVMNWIGRRIELVESLMLNLDVTNPTR